MYNVLFELVIVAADGLFMQLFIFMCTVNQIKDTASFTYIYSNLHVNPLCAQGSTKRQEMQNWSQWL